MAAHDPTPVTTAPAQHSTAAAPTAPTKAPTTPLWRSPFLGGTVGAALLMLGNQWGHWGLPMGGTLGLTVGLAALWGIHVLWLEARYGPKAAANGADLPYFLHLIDALEAVRGLPPQVATATHDVLPVVDRILTFFENRHQAQEAADAASATQSHEANNRFFEHAIMLLQYLLPHLMQKAAPSAVHVEEPKPASSGPVAEPAAPDPAPHADPAPAAVGGTVTGTIQHAAAAEAAAPAPEAHA